MPGWTNEWPFTSGKCSPLSPLHAALELCGQGKVVVYGGDNKVVYHWICGRRSRVRAGKLLIRVLNLVEMRFRCQVLGGWWRTVPQ